MKPKIKICGLKSKTDIKIAAHAEVDMIGFVFFEESPRSIKVSAAAKLMESAPKNILKVALTVNAGDGLLEEIIKKTSADFLQFHGNETLARLSEIKSACKLGIIKVVPVSSRKDIKEAKKYEPVADYLMFDAKPPANATRPGGNATKFDWLYLKNAKFSVPWILAGGLDPDNVAQAVQISGADFVDVSSGVESYPGKKDHSKIKAFVTAARKIEGM